MEDNGPKIKASNIREKTKGIQLENISKGKVTHIKVAAVISYIHSELEAFAHLITSRQVDVSCHTC